ncbi:MAG TPA: MFS transporter [Gammaproteobacteria bacterium]
MNAQKMTHYRWTICALLFFALTINFIDRQILALIKPILDAELGWSNKEFGMVNSAFQGAYGIGLIWFGWFIDRYGTRIGYALSMATWSVTAMAHALIGSVHSFMYVRIALGLSEGGNLPSVIKAAALWFPKRERAFATSIFNAGTHIGAIVAPLIVPFVALTWGWRAAFIGAGIAGFIWLLFWFPLYNVPEKIKRLNAAERAYINSDVEDKSSTEKSSISWLSLLKYPQTWSFVVAKFTTDPIWWFFMIWLPDYFNKTRGLNINQSWAHLISIYSIITVLSISGGWVTGYLNQRGWSVTRARKSGMFVFAILVLPIFAVTHVGDWSAVLLIALAGAAHQAWSANLFTTVSDMFPKYAVASVVGIGGLAGAIGGMIFPVFCGVVLDKFTAANNITAGYTQLFSICAFTYLITFAAHHFLAPRFEQLKLNSA